MRCVQSIRVLRVLCREEFSVASAKTFVDDLKRAMQWLSGHYMYTPEQVQTYSTLLAEACVASMLAFLLPSELDVPDLPHVQSKI